MDIAVKIFDFLGNLGGVIGLAWAAWGVFDLVTGIRREDDIKKDKGMMAIVLGGVLGAALKAIFSAVAAALQNMNF